MLHAEILRSVFGVAIINKLLNDTRAGVSSLFEAEAVTQTPGVERQRATAAARVAITR